MPQASANWPRYSPARGVRRSETMSSELAKKHSLYAITSDAAPGSSLDQRQSENAAQPVAVCPSCSGTGWEFVADKEVRPCRCRTEARRAKLLADACIPQLYGESSLQTYQPSKG